jgi:hypothetical protein
VNAVIVGTIWGALAMFVAVEALSRGTGGGVPAGRLFRLAAASGVLLLVAHIVMAMGARHGWSHDAAVRQTAAQTADVYGLAWGGGVYVNYIFAGIWAWDAWRRHRSIELARGWLWVLRAFYFMIIFNAAVVFVPGPRRWVGAIFTIALLWVWRPINSGARSKSAAPA